MFDFSKKLGRWSLVKNFVFAALIFWASAGAFELAAQQVPVPVPTPLPEISEIVSEDSDIEFLQENPSETAPAQRKTANTEIDRKLKELGDRLKTVEAKNQNVYDEQQKRLLLSLDILTKTEERAENLRKKLIEMIEKETQVKTQLEAIEYNMQPENIERSTAIYGSLRPEEIRDQRRNNLQTEKRNLEALLAQIQANRLNLEESVRKADQWVEKVREKFEKQIDQALEITEENL